MVDTLNVRKPGAWRRDVAVKAFVFLIALVILGYGFEKPSIANAIPDPISRYRAQDEALYSHIALRMARSGDWLTPHYLGRLLLYKPPLLMWLSGFSLKALGTSLLALRLPALLAGALGALLVFGWPQGFGARAIALLLIVSNPYWHTFSRLCLTDILHAAFLTGAMCVLAANPKLDRRAGFWGFAALSALDIMAKSVSGLLAPLGLLIYCAIARPDDRPAKGRLLALLLAIAALAAPWHIYQLVVHTNWFWADYVQYQLLNYGLQPPPQGSHDGAAVFYLRRLWAGDPFLCLLMLLALPWFIRAAWRRTSSRTGVLVAWVVIIATTFLLFQYHSERYIASLVPPLCLIASQYGPVTKRRASAAVAGILCVLFVVKVAGAGTWRLSYGREAPNPMTVLLRDYYEKDRGNELVLVQPDDDFYSSALPGLEVRYCFVDPQGPQNFPQHFLNLGIVLTVDQFLDAAGTGRYEDRLNQWGVRSAQSIGSVLIALGTDDVVKLGRAHPEWDFLLPAELRATALEMTRSSHDLLPACANMLFLLSRKAIPCSRPKLPRHW